MLVADPESQPRIDVEVVRAALGLTPAESQLATMVAAGERVRDIAVRTGRSEGTVRWHLNRIFRKQGISGQAELMRRVLSLDGFPRYRSRRTRINSGSIRPHSEPDPTAAAAVGGASPGTRLTPLGRRAAYPEPTSSSAASASTCVLATRSSTEQDSSGWWASSSGPGP